MTLLRQVLVAIIFAIATNNRFASADNSQVPRSCYQCTSGPNDGCDDPAKLSKWVADCPPGTQGCLKMKAPGSPLIRSCGNPPDSPVPIKDGCVNKPNVGIICSCSSSSLCNDASSERTLSGAVLVGAVWMSLGLMRRMVRLLQD